MRARAQTRSTLRSALLLACVLALAAVVAAPPALATPTGRQRIALAHNLRLDGDTAFSCTRPLERGARPATSTATAARIS